MTAEVGLTETEVDAIEVWVHPAAVGRLCLVVERIVREREAKARAEALRSAASDVAAALSNEIGSGHTSTYSVRRWLQERADIEAAR